MYDIAYNIRKRHSLFLNIPPEVPEVRKKPEPEKKVPVAVPKKVEAPPAKGIYAYNASCHLRKRFSVVRHLTFFFGGGEWIIELGLISFALSVNNCLIQAILLCFFSVKYVCYSQ